MKELFLELREANQLRNQLWDLENKLTPDFFFRELVGEIGELFNVVKKLDRAEAGIRGSTATIQDFSDELADSVICADLLLLSKGGPHLTLHPVRHGKDAFRDIVKCLGLIAHEMNCAPGSVNFTLVMNDLTAALKRLADDYVVDLRIAVPLKYNKTSNKYGLPIHMEIK